MKFDFKKNLLCFVIALALVVGVFGDVVFAKGTLSMLDMANITKEARTTGVYHPESPIQQVHYGYTDTGGAAFQSEPMIQFMKYAIQKFQSPYWNPFSGTGALGPETLIDNKFSPVTVFTALLGGSTIAFHFVLLFFYILAVYFIIRLSVQHFKLSLLAGVLSGVVYLLNGYSTANISSNVAQSYLYFPFLLFGLCSLVVKTNLKNFTLAILANIFVLATTFLPTTTWVVLSCYLIAVAFSFNQFAGWKNRLKIIGIQLLSGLIAFLLLAFLWLPIFESFRNFGLFQMYSTRHFYEASKRALLLLFTPKQYWNSYGATPDQVWNYINNVVFHFGVVASLVVALIFSNRKNFRNWVIGVSLGLLILLLGRIFAIPGLYQLYGILPEIKNIGEQYLWVGVAIPFTILVGFGLDNLIAKKIKIPLAITYLIILLSILYLQFNFLPQAPFYIGSVDSIAYRIFLDFNLGILALIIIASLVIFAHLFYRPERDKLFKVLLVILVFMELFYYLDTMRYKRQDIFANPPDYIRFIKENIGDNRLVTYSWNFNPELGSAYQIFQVETQNYTFPWYRQFYERNFQTPNDRWSTFQMVLGQRDEPNIHEEIYDLLSVKYIITDVTMSKYLNYFKEHDYPVVYEDGTRTIFENTDPMPRVNIEPVLINQPLTPDTQGYSVRNVVFTQDEKLLSEATKLGVSNDPDSTESIGTAEIASFENAKVKIHVNLTKPGVLAMMDNWNPNWQATANGQPVYVGRINESFRGIVLPAGDYTIEVTYAPKTLKLGLTLFGITGFLLLLLLFFRRKIDKFLARLVESEQTQEPQIPLNKQVSFAVVLPMFNESVNVVKCIGDVNAVLKRYPQKTAIIAVDDGSTDETLKILHKESKKIPHLIVAKHARNKGFGVANVTGAKTAKKHKFDYALFMDADLTQDPKYIPAFVREMEKGTDYIKATRYSLGGKVKGVPFKRRIVSQVGNFLAKIFFRLPISDYTNGFRAVKTELLAQIKTQDTSFAYLTEEVRQIKKIAKTYAEIPYTLTVRVEGSKSKFRYNPMVYFNYLKYLFKK